MELVPAQRACVILKDVLDMSLEDIAHVLGITVPAVKAALHRGRARLRELDGNVSPPSARVHTAEILRYVDLFNARDWDGVRSMLAHDVKLDLVGHGSKKADTYFSNYSKRSDWYLFPAWMDGREVIAVRRAPADARPAYVMELTIADGRIAVVRDYVHAGHVVDEATFSD